jgi:hypothetical protein
MTRLERKVDCGRIEAGPYCPVEAAGMDLPLNEQPRPENRGERAEKHRTYSDGCLQLLLRTRKRNPKRHYEALSYLFERVEYRRHYICVLCETSLYEHFLLNVLCDCDKRRRSTGGPSVIATETYISSFSLPKMLFRRKRRKI